MPSTIEWTDETWNSVTGCTRVSREAGVAFCLKQLSGRLNKRGGDAAVIDGETWRQMPHDEG